MITTDSCHVHREIARTMPILRRFRRAKLNNDQVKSISAVLDRYTEYVRYALMLIIIYLFICLFIYLFITPEGDDKMQT